jgi:oxygen-independent coproporphyrinogen-3 oxidase
MVVSRSQSLYARYLDALELEAARVAQAMGARARVVQVHLGGGTPTALDEAQLTKLVETLQRHFPFERGIEISIEVHPVQDFDAQVQQRINRPQPFEQTRDLALSARALGFVSVNLDLMYGLPLQTVERFDSTLDKVGEIRPERLALFGYAHMPSLKKHQRAVDAAELPSPQARVALFTHAVRRLSAMGYVCVGLDHFALAGDELCRARAQGTLRRNFMGYTTCAQSDVIALGPSSISEVGGTFLQNEREVHAWASRLEAGELPIVRGWKLTADDQLRGDVIQRLFCDLEVDPVALSRRHGVDFTSVCARELKELEALERDGLLEREGERLKVTALGQLLLRNVAAVFDSYLRPQGPRVHSAAV